jgi:hypothetical protein
MDNQDYPLFMVKTLYPATAAKAAIVRANLLLCGATGVRVRVMPNGAMRLVLASADQRGAVRDALVLSDACTHSGNLFTSPDSRFAWNGATEISIRFAVA